MGGAQKAEVLLQTWSQIAREAGAAETKLANPGVVLTEGLMGHGVFDSKISKKSAVTDHISLSHTLMPFSRNILKNVIIQKPKNKPSSASFVC